MRDVLNNRKNLHVAVIVNDVSEINLATNKCAALDACLLNDDELAGGKLPWSTLEDPFEPWVTAGAQR